MAEQWNGTAWTVVSTPNPDGESIVDLTGISCIGSAWCTAVGQGFVTGTGYQSLVEQWNGSTWSIVPSPNVPTVNNFLQGVDCFSMTSCSAVGYVRLRATPEALAWNGTTWTARDHAEPDGRRQHAAQRASPASPTGPASDSATAPPPASRARSRPAHRSPAPATASWPPTAACSPTGAARRSSAPWAGRRSTSRSSAWPSCPPVTATTSWPSDGGIFNFGSATFYGSTGGIAPQRADRRHGGDRRRRRVLARGLRRRRVHLRRRPVLRVDRIAPLEQAHRGHGRHAGRPGLLPGGLRRRHLQLRRRHLPGLGRLAAPQQAGGRHGRPRWPAATTWSPPTAASSPTRPPGDRPSTARRARSSSTSRSSG